VARGGARRSARGGIGARARVRERLRCVRRRRRDGHHAARCEVIDPARRSESVALHLGAIVLAMLLAQTAQATPVAAPAPAPHATTATPTRTRGAKVAVTVAPPRHD